MKKAMHRILSNTWFRQICILLVVAAAGAVLLTRLPILLAFLWENFN